MKLLLTSSGITNRSILEALTGLLGKPVSESHALYIPTAIYPFAYGARYAWQPIGGKSQASLCGLGWKTLGLLELSVLPSIEKHIWLPAVRDADALLFGGGDPLFLSYWLAHSGLAALLPSLLAKTVYVGVSAGSIAASATFGETYQRSPGGRGTPLETKEVVFSTPGGQLTRNLIIANGAGLIDFAIIPHYENKDHSDASASNAEKWASMMPCPSYALDDQSAIRVVDGLVEVVSEGVWKFFNG